MYDKVVKKCLNMLGIRDPNSRIVQQYIIGGATRCIFPDPFNNARQEVVEEGGSFQSEVLLRSLFQLHVKVHRKYTIRVKGLSPL